MKKKYAFLRVNSREGEHEYLDKSVFEFEEGENLNEVAKEVCKNDYAGEDAEEEDDEFTSDGGESYSEYYRQRQ